MPILHTEMSDNGLISCIEPLKGAKNMSEKWEYCAVTDRNTLTSVYEIWEYCDKNEIPFFPGAEINTEHGYLTLLPLDIEGYKAISLAITEGECVKRDCGKFQVKDEVIERLFNAKSPYHGKILAFTGCTDGIIGSVLFRNKSIETHINELEIRLAALPVPSEEKLKKIEEDISSRESEYEAAYEQYDNAKKTVKMPMKKRLSVLKKRLLKAGAADVDTYIDTRCFPTGYTPDETDIECYRDLQKIENAKKSVNQLKSDVEQAKKALTTMREFYEKICEKTDDYKEINNEKEKLLASLSSSAEIKEETIRSIERLKTIFGEGNVLGEIFPCNTDRDIRELNNTILELSNKCGLPLFASINAIMEDSYDITRLEFTRSKNSRKTEYEPLSEYDRSRIIMSPDEVKAVLCQIVPENSASKAIKNALNLKDICNIEKDKGKYYPKYCEDSEEKLRNLAYSKIESRFPGKTGWTDEYAERLENELQVISDMGFCDYFLIEADILEYADKAGKVPTEKLHEAPLTIAGITKWCEENGYDTGMGEGFGRGSAAGSLVCYLIGITGLDPIKNDLLFERFLNIERISMPDIDTDFEPEVRKKVVEYVSSKYGADRVCGIMTKGTQAAKSAIKNCARIMGVRDTGSKKAYAELADRIAADIPNEPNIKINDCITSLKAVYGDDKKAMEIIDTAMSVEGSFAQYGIHPAGIIISDDEPVKNHIPLMWDENAGIMKTQCDMIHAESNGLLKMDFLVLENLTIISETLRELKKNGIKMDVYHLPMEKEVFREIYAKGNTMGVFQFESEGMRKMLKEFKPDSFDDLILLNAAYRPGPMESLPDIINAKENGQIPDSVEQIRDILESTYGSIIYQEQVMQIFQRAGYSLGGADIVRRAMSKKHLDEIQAEKEAFLYGDSSRGIIGAIASGWDENASITLFDRMTAFASYAFNKSHAAVYSYLSYVTAYLKYHYPAAFFSSFLSHADRKKYPAAVRECKRLGIKVEGPSVNHSGINFENDGDMAVRFSLSSIKGIVAEAEKITEERKNGKFESLQDFCLRTEISKGTLCSFAKAGALDCFGMSRNTIVEHSEDIVKKLKKRTADKYTELLYPNIPDTNEEKSLMELEMLGVCVSVDPLDGYKPGLTPISSLTAEKHTKTSITGLISKFREIARKSDGKKMAFLTIEDKNGEISAICFADSYEINKNLLADGNVCTFEGYIKSEENSENENELIFIVQSVIKATPKKTYCTVIINSENNHSEFIEILNKCKDPNGSVRLSIYDDKTGLCDSSLCGLYRQEVVSRLAASNVPLEQL